MTTFDAVLNFAKTSLVGTLPSGSLSFTVASGTGSLFPNPSTSGAYNITIWNATDYPYNPEDDPLKEILRVTAISTDTFTILRAQEGTSDNAHVLSGKTYRIALTVSAKTIDDIQDAINARGELTGNNTWSGSNTFSALTANTVPYLNGSKVLTSSAVTPTELGYLSGVTSSIQSQINALPALVDANVWTNTNEFQSTITSDGLKARQSAGLLFEANNGTDVVLLGAGGGAGATFYGGVTIAGTVTAQTSLSVNTTSPIGKFQVTTGDTATISDYAFIKSSGAVANQGGLLIGNAANGTSGYRAFKVTATYAGTAASTSATLGFVDEAATETFLSNANGHMNFYHNSGAGYVNFNTLITCQSSISSIYSNVITTSDATLSVLTGGLTKSANLVSTPYVSDGYTAGVTWSSTTDNATKPKAGIFCKTTGSGTYVYIGTSDDYASGVTHLGFAVGPSGKTYFGASTTGTASLNIASGSAPSTPSDGDVWYDGTNLKMQIGATTKTFTLI